jgi:zinc protease
MIAALALLTALAPDGAATDPAASNLASAPRVEPLPAVRLAPPTTFTLPNGLAVIAVPRHAAPLLTLRLVVCSGADADPADRAGLAAATADMLDEGAGERGALDIARDVDALGGELGLGATRDASLLSLTLPSPGRSRGLALLADLVLRPRFAEEDWRRVQNDRLTALVQRRDQPEAVAALVSDRALYGDRHPYGRPPAGYERTVGAITVADLRRFHQRHWRSSNAALVVVGDYDPATLRGELEQALGAWSKGPRAPSPVAAAPSGRPPRVVLVDKPDAPQTVLRVVGPGAARTSPDRPPLAMLATVLGGSFTSRLNFNLRERNGYSYGAFARFQFLRAPGPFAAGASVFTRVTDAALGEVLKELAALAGPFRPDEVGKARALLQQQIAESLSTTAGTANLYAELATYGLPLDEPARFLRALAGAAGNPERLRRLAARAVDPRVMTIVAVGDRKTIEPALRKLGLPPPQVRDADGELVTEKAASR